jgi:hypothetical protein
MSRKTKERTEEEAIELALSNWRSSSANHLGDSEIKECTSSSVLAIGSPSEDWIEVLGRRPKEKAFFEVHFYRPTEDGLGVETSFAKFLVPKNRSEGRCEAIWTAAKSGPWFPSLS